MAAPIVSVWTDPPKMDVGAPQPSFARDGDLLSLAYRTHRGDHFAVLRFEGVSDFSFGDPSDERLHTHPLYQAGLRFYSFHEVCDEGAVSTGLRRWIITFHDDTLEVTARRAAVVVRAVQARSAENALAAVRA